MNPREYGRVIAKLNREIDLLRHHLDCAHVPGIAQHILKEIAQNKPRIRLILEKSKAQPPEAGRKTLDRETQRAVK